MSNPTEIPDVVRSIAVAKYSKYANNVAELKSGFKNAVMALDNTFVVTAEAENHVRMAIDIERVVRLGRTHKDEVDEMAKLAGAKTPETIYAAFEQSIPTRVFSIEMNAHYAQNNYELDARCQPTLVEQAHRRLITKKGTSEVTLDLAFEEVCRFLDSVFIGGMNCDRILSPRSLRSGKSTHTVLVNVSKTRTQLTDVLLESLKRASKEILVVGWVGSYILPLLKSCVERGVDLKIITHKPEQAEGSRGGRDKATTFAEMPKFLRADSVRILPSCHARMIIVDEATAFVGSMDLDSEALAERDETAIMSNDMAVIGDAKAAFQEFFSMGQRPQWPNKTV